MITNKMASGDANANANATASATASVYYLIIMMVFPRHIMAIICDIVPSN